MQKITAQICINTNNLIYETATGYKAKAWGEDMLLTKHLGYWQAYDIDSRMCFVMREPTKKATLAKLRQTEQDISTEVYQQAARYWKHRQGRLEESEQSISFQLSKLRYQSLAH